MKNFFRNVKFAAPAVAAVTIVAVTALTAFAGPGSSPPNGNVDATFNTVTTGNGSSSLGGKLNAVSAVSNPSTNGATDPSGLNASAIEQVAKYATVVGQANGKDAVGVYGTTDNTSTNFSAGIIGDNQATGILNAGIFGMSANGVAGIFMSDPANVAGTVYIFNQGKGSALSVSNQSTGTAISVNNSGTGNGIAIGGSTGGIPLFIDNRNNGSSDPAMQIVNNSTKPTGPAFQILDSLGHPLFPWNTNFQINTDGSMSNPSGVTNSGAVAVINPKGFITNATTGTAISGISTDTTTNAIGVYGQANATGSAGEGVEGVSLNAGVEGYGRIGVSGTDTNGSGWGVDGTSPTHIGVEGDTSTGYAVDGKVSGSSGTAGYFTAPHAFDSYGVYSQMGSGASIIGSTNAAVQGSSDSADGVVGITNSGTYGVWGYNDGSSGYGVRGEAGAGAEGVKGSSASNYGVEGYSASSSGGYFSNGFSGNAVSLGTQNNAVEATGHVKATQGVGNVYTLGALALTSVPAGSFTQLPTISCTNTTDRVLGCGVDYALSGTVVNAGIDFPNSYSCQVGAYNVNPAATTARAYITCWNPNGTNW